MASLTSKGPKIGVRHIQAILIFFNISVIYMSRLNVGIAVVAMTNAETTNPNFPEYDWSDIEISYILSSFYWGYVFTQFLGGYFGRRYGAKITMVFATLGSAIFSLITPLCIPWGGWQIFCGIRVIQGLFQGVIFPCIHDHLAKWSPLLERNRLGALSHTGVECGFVISMFLSGIIAESALGWPGISYVSCGLCIIWSAFWWIFAANNPRASKYISVAECEYIETSLQHATDFYKHKIPIPWKAILTSMPFYALVIARCASAYGVSTIQAEMPIYFNGVLNMNIRSNAFYSSLPFIAMWAGSYVYLLAADIILKRKLLTLSVLRKTFNTMAHWFPACALVAIGFLHETEKTLAVSLLTISVGFSSGATIGSALNTIDLSPNHASLLMGIVNTIANFVPIITPLLAGYIVTTKDNRSQWQIVFILAAVVFFAGNLIYIIWGSVARQPWDAEDFLLSNFNKKAEQQNKKLEILEGTSSPNETQNDEKVKNTQLP